MEHDFNFQGILMVRFNSYFNKYKKISNGTIESFLRLNSIRPTRQRVMLVDILASEKESHFTVSDIFQKTAKRGLKMATGTIYNSLNKFKNKGLIKEVVIDSEHRFYDTNTGSHHHFYLEEENRLIDIDSKSIKLKKIPFLPKNKEVSGIDIVIRLEQKSYKE